MVFSSIFLSHAQVRDREIMNEYEWLVRMELVNYNPYDLAFLIDLIFLIRFFLGYEGGQT